MDAFVVLGTPNEIHPQARHIASFLLSMYDEFLATKNKCLTADNDPFIICSMPSKQEEPNEKQT